MHGTMKERIKIAGIVMKPRLTGRRIVIEQFFLLFLYLSLSSIFLINGDLLIGEGVGDIIS